MQNLIFDGDPSWSYRVLKGGFNNLFDRFRPAIENSQSYQNNNVDLENYVPDMREAYAKTDLVFFPSFYEGYGMAAIEPMYMGTPVVCSSYPAILEAVGDSAFAVCPHKGKAQDWRNAVSEVLDNHSYWKQKAKQRVSFTRARQAKEIDLLSRFLSSLL